MRSERVAVATVRFGVSVKSSTLREPDTVACIVFCAPSRRTKGRECEPAANDLSSTGAPFSEASISETQSTVRSSIFRRPTE